MPFRRKNMKRLVAIIAAIITVLMPSFTAQAATKKCTCTCGCECCGGKKETSSKTSLKKDTSNLLAPVREYAAKYGWTTETKVSKSTSSKRYTDVHFDNRTTQVAMDVQIRATKNGAVWYCKVQGEWKKTSTEKVEEALRANGKKVSKKAKAKTVAEATEELLKPVKEYAAKYGWTTEIDIYDEDTDYQFTRVHFHSDEARKYLDVEIHADKSTGVATAGWWFLDDNEEWKHSTSERIEGVLKKYSGRG